MTLAPKTIPSSREFEASRFAPCTPVQATSPAAQSPGSAVAPVEVGYYSTAEVVGGRRHGDPVRSRFEAQLPHRCRESREPLLELRDPADVEPDVVDAVFAHLGRDRGRDDVTWLHLVDEAPAAVGAKKGSFAPQRLAEQWPGPRDRTVKSRRVELHELDVCDSHTGPQRHRQAVSSALCRIRGHRIELSRTPCGQQGVRGPYLDGAPVGSDRSHAVGSDHPRPGDRVAKWPSQMRLARALATSTRVRSTSAPVAAPPAWTTRATEWPPSRASSHFAVVSAVELGPECRQLAQPDGPSATRISTAWRSQSPPPALRVSATCSSVESPAGGVSASVWLQDRGHPALSPLGGRVGQGTLSTGPRSSSPSSAKRLSPRRTGRPPRCRRSGGPDR